MIIQQLPNKVININQLRQLECEALHDDELKLNTTITVKANYYKPKTGFAIRFLNPVDVFLTVTEILILENGEIIGKGNIKTPLDHHWVNINFRFKDGLVHIDRK
jgi:hypothetical protein